MINNRIKFWTGVEKYKRARPGPKIIYKGPPPKELSPEKLAQQRAQVQEQKQREHEERAQRLREFAEKIAEPIQLEFGRPKEESEEEEQVPMDIDYAA